ncbi:uncharacterized protein LOC125656109 [Ostrea edulis]|uniref:uncharacterized protein LOC125656109 n=1 Tax=Ostrea edulis TaxID=37623 RepID=UPI0024AF3462|nr:uncharacterized protein LOC125656109 [Ostrea edulis]
MTSFTSMVTFLVYYILINNDDSANGLLKHGITFIFFISHLGLSRKPFRILHCYLSLIFVFVYVIITVIYQKGFRQMAVYDIFDWDNAPNAVLYSFFLVVLAPVTAMACFALTLLRDFVSQKCRKVDEETEKFDSV